MSTSAIRIPSMPVNPSIRSVSEGGRQVLDLLLKTGGLSQAEITRSLELAQPTVARLLQGFQQDGLVSISGRQTDRPGNPSVHVTLNGDFAFAFGVSLLADKLSLTLLDFAGKVRGVRAAAMPTMTRDAVLSRLQAFRTDLVCGSEIDPKRVVGVGAGLSGFYVGESNWLNPPAALDDWALVDAAQILSDAFGLPAMIDNDGNVAAIAESLFGVGRKSKTFAYLHLTNGFGGGLIADGRPFRGQHGNAGEFGGVWTVTESEYPSLDRLRSCLAAQGHDFETVEDMVQTIDESWSGVDEWLDIAAVSFSRLSTILTYVFDPEAVVLGGRLPPSIARALAARIKVEVSSARRGRALPVPRIVVGEVSDDPVGLGASVMPLHEAFFAHNG